MIKIKKVFEPLAVVIIALAFLGVMSWAGVSDFDAVRVKDAGDTYQLEVQNSSGTRKFSVDDSGNIYVAGTLQVVGTLTATTTRSVPLPILGFWVQENATTVTPLGVDTLSTPAHVVISSNVPLVKLGNGYTTPIVMTFRIPDDYSSGGAFKLMANQSGTTTACTVDFDVYVNAAGSTMDSAATDQTPVSLLYAGTTPSQVTLTPATDFAAIAAGQWVTLRIWRGTTTGTDALQVGNATFFYTARQ